MGITLPWHLYWTPTTLSGTHPTLPGWTIQHWRGDLEEIKHAVLNTFLLQMLDDKPFNLDQAASHHLTGWVIYSPISGKYYNRCELWDSLWRLRVLDGVPEEVISKAIGVKDFHDVVQRLSPTRVWESWSDWHKEVYSVLEKPPW